MLARSSMAELWLLLLCKHESYESLSMGEEEAKPRGRRVKYDKMCHLWLLPHLVLFILLHPCNIAVLIIILIKGCSSSASWLKLGEAVSSKTEGTSAGLGLTLQIMGGFAPCAHVCKS